MFYIFFIIGLIIISSVIFLCKDVVGYSYNKYANILNREEQYSNYTPLKDSDEAKSIMYNLHIQPYKQFNFNQIESKQGNMINNACTDCIQSIQPYYDASVTDYKHANFYTPVGSYSSLRSLNTNIALSTCPVKHNIENKTIRLT